jgi:hypothetical protein
LSRQQFVWSHSGFIGAVKGEAGHEIHNCQHYRVRIGGSFVARAGKHLHVQGHRVPAITDGPGQGTRIGRSKIAKIEANRIENYERSRGIWTNLFGGSKKNSEENSEK